VLALLEIQQQQQQQQQRQQQQASRSTSSRWQRLWARQQACWLG